MVDIVQYYGDSDSGTIEIQTPVPFAGVAWTWIKVDHGDPQIHYCYKSH